MTKIEALIELMSEARQERTTTTAAKRAVRSCKALGLSAEETRAVLSWLDYCDATTGKPHKAAHVVRVWP